MKLLILPRLLKMIFGSIYDLVIGGWMSGSYTGAVLTEDYHLAKFKAGRSGNLPGAIKGVTFFK